jgi:hypothetical protein
MVGRVWPRRSGGGRPLNSVVRLSSSDLAIYVKERILTQKYLSTAVFSIVCSLFSGCTSQQLYGIGQEYQRNQCLHIPDKIESDRCLSKINTSYDDYKREKESRTK